MSEFLMQLEAEKKKLYNRRGTVIAKIATLRAELKDPLIPNSPYRARVIRIAEREFGCINRRLEQIQKHFDNAQIRLDRAWLKEQELVKEIGIKQQQIYDLAWQIQVGLKVAENGNYNLEDRIFSMTQELSTLRDNLRKRREYQTQNEKVKTEAIVLYEAKRAAKRKPRKSIVSTTTEIRTPVVETPSSDFMQAYLDAQRMRGVKDTKTAL
jgi:hypothetical protein